MKRKKTTAGRCSVCGKPEEHPAHAKYGGDEDNPRKHRWEPSNLKGWEMSQVKLVNESIPLQSLLYDLDLLPEQLEVGSEGWKRMLIAVTAFDLGCKTASRTKSTRKDNR